jgi:thiol-disulfide isomerase/thioredoxin
MIDETPDNDLTSPEQPKRSWESWFAIATLLLAAVVIAFLFGVFDRPLSGEGVNHPSVGKSIGEINLTPLDEKKHPPLKTESLKGKVTLINLWGPWCNYCLVEFPELTKIVEHHSEDSDVQFAFVSFAADGKNASDEHLSETRELLVSKGYRVPTYTDPTQTTSKSIAALLPTSGVSFPTSLLVGPDGKVKGVWVGYAPHFPAEMHDAIHTAVHELAK